ncbi:MAG: hypothetical protein ACQEQC_00425 [Elusimicrobiota bacterium]
MKLMLLSIKNWTVNLSIKKSYKLKVIVIFLLLILSSPLKADTDFIEKRVLEICNELGKSNLPTIPDRVKKEAKDFYKRVDNVDTPRKVKLEEELICYQVPLKSGDEFLDMIYITPDGKNITEWPGYRTEGAGEDMYKPSRWKKNVSVPLVLRRFFFNYPKLISVDKPSFLTRVGMTIYEADRIAKDNTIKRSIALFLSTDREYIGNKPVNRQWGFPVNPETADFLIDEYDKIPYKNLQEKKAWINSVNKAYDLKWNYMPGSRAVSAKCMSYAASYISDWFKIRNSSPPYKFNSYISYLRGEEELGMNPRVLEILYNKRAVEKKREQYAKQPPLEEDDELNLEEIPSCPITRLWYKEAQDLKSSLKGSEATLSGAGAYKKIPFFTDDVTGEPMNSSLEGFAKVLSSEWEPGQLRDPVIKDFEYNIHRNPSGIKDYEVLFSANTGADEKTLINALESRGIVLAGIIYRNFGVPLDISVHSVAIIGYKDVGGKKYFVYKEVFGEHDWKEPETEKGGPSYRMMPVEEFHSAYSFISG